MIRAFDILRHKVLLTAVSYTILTTNNLPLQQALYPIQLKSDFSKYQLNAQFFYSSKIYMLHYAPQHVSSSTLLILRKANCITTASGIVTLCKQPYSMQVESGLQSALHLHKRIVH